MTIRHNIAPGLAELAEAEQLTDAQVERLNRAITFSRGRMPVTVEEWRNIWNAIKVYLPQEDEAKR